jgi:hypothetical protein
MREFNKLWAGQSISQLGSQITVFALPSLAILTLHASAAQVGAIAALEQLPFLFFGLIAGVWIDRLARRAVMIVADIGRFSLLAYVTAAAAMHWLQMSNVYAVAFVLGTCTVFFDIAFQAYLPTAVAQKDLPNANVKLGVSNSGARIVGNAIAGVLVQLVGSARALSLDAASYVLSLISLALVKVDERKTQRLHIPAENFGAQIRDGLRVVLGATDLRAVTLSSATMNLGGAMIESVILLFAYRTLHMTPGVLGLVCGLANLGFIGAVLAPRVCALLGLKKTLVTTLLGSGVGYMMILLAQYGAAPAIVFIGIAIPSVLLPVYGVSLVTYRQSAVPDELQGRMNATMRTISWGTLPAGAVLGGWLGTTIGLPGTLALGAAALTVSAGWLLPFRERCASSPDLTIATAGLEPSGTGGEAVV